MQASCGSRGEETRVIHARDTRNNPALIFTGIPLRTPHCRLTQCCTCCTTHHQDIADLHVHKPCRKRMEAPSIPLSSQCLMQAYMSTHCVQPGNTQWLSSLTRSPRTPTKVRPGRQTEVCAPT